jgi:two-component system, NtrC family, sensor kinase
MKKPLIGLLLFSLLLLSGYDGLLAQKKTETHIDSLPIDLEKGWRWQAGDNLNFAKTDFDDSHWQAIDPSLPIKQLTQITDAQIGWLRLVVQPDSSLVGKTLYFYTMQSGASEIYIDGYLLTKLGVVSKDPSKERLHSPQLGTPTFFSFKTARRQVIAVRYSFSKGNNIWPFGLNGNHAAFGVRINHSDGLLNKIKEYVSHSAAYNWFLLALFLTMAMLHLILFLYNRSKTINRTFAITLLFAALHFWAGHLGDKTNNMLHAERYHALYVVAIIVYLNMLAYTVIKYLNQKTTIFYWLFASTLLLSALLSVTFNWPWLGYVYYSMCFLLLCEVIRVVFKSKKIGNKDANVLLVSFGLLIVLYLLRLLIIKGIIDVGSMPYLANYLMASFYICTAATLSILLAKNNALNEIALQKKLIEIKTLSAEKQQILATQNETLERQVAERTAALNQSLAALKATQAQLIQSEKLASLGELTAGIAHEIQNPLNFVTNFSELSVELIEEVPKPPKGASKDWTPTDSPIGGWELFFTDIRQNLEKINHHGKRASSIVKAMLEHSRASTGVKEPTDINKLADEYLRLSYHGLRAKDSNDSTTRFNADFELIADPNLPLINVVQQDIGRVLLNLINNAFQAVLQNDVETLPATSLPKYQPIVVVATQKIDNQIVIKISDNGSGMSEATKAKIFQPFFTTKSAGEGTGLGLSLAYDIITKGHGGTIEVESEEGKGATFTVMLPIINS